MQYLNVCESKQISGGLDFGDLADAAQVGAALGGLGAIALADYAGVTTAGALLTAAGLGAAAGAGLVALGGVTYAGTTLVNDYFDGAGSDAVLNAYEGLSSWGSSIGLWTYDVFHDASYPIQGGQAYMDWFIQPL